MIATKNLFENIQLAEASYSLFDGLSPGGDTALRSRLLSQNRDDFNGEFSSAQADALISKWSLFAHQENTAYGFSATLFVNKESPSEVVLAIRGTEFSIFDGKDLGADIGDIALDGLALHQIMDLYNYWQYLSAPAGVAYAAARFVDFNPLHHVLADAIIDLPTGRVMTVERGASTSFFGGTDRALASGAASAATKIIVAGHSLGGHLAAAFTRLFPLSNADAVLANGAGFVTANANVDRMFRLLNGAASFDVGRIANVFADKGPEIVAQDWYLQQGGGRYPVFSETAIGYTFGHGVGQVTDSLAVYDLFFRLSAQIRNGTPIDALAALKPLFEAFSAQAVSSLERIVDALINLFGLDFPLLVGSLNNNREELYKRIAPLQAVTQNLSNNNPEMHVDVLVLPSVTKEGLALLASGDTARAYRYALRELNPFAIIGYDGLYTQHSVNGELDLYNEVTGNGELSELWVQYRAEMLGWKNEFYEADGDVTLRSARSETIQFVDKSGFAQAEGHDLVIMVVGRQESAVSNPGKVVFGSGLVDFIEGSNLAIGDYLYGAAGDDVLQGHGGDDYVEGGRGVDTYIWNDGDGFDTILDTDGLGQIVVDGTSLSGGFRLANGSYISTDKKFQYVLDGDLVSGGDLYINGSIAIRGFKNGSLGIILNNNSDISAIQPTQNVLIANILQFAIGTDLNDHFVSGVLLPDGTGNLRSDYLFVGLGGDDLVTPSDSLVPLELDSGVNLFGGAGNDVLFSRETLLIHSGINVYGEGGDDAIYGGDGDDFLWGDTDIAMLNFQPGSNVESTDIQISFLSMTGVEPFFTYIDGIGQYWDGNSGNEIGGEIVFSDGLRGVLQWLGITSSATVQSMHNDVIHGKGGADSIYGGAGDDLIYGGAGNDLLFGGNGPAGGIFWIHNPSLNLMPFAFAQQIRDLLSERGDDYLDGGDGSDYIVDSDGGDDRLNGGDGSDVIRDQNPNTPNLSSSDYIDGGGGDDLLFSEHLYAADVTVGASRLYGGEGDDLLAVMEGEHYLEGGSGNDGYWIKGVAGRQFVTIRNHGDAGVAIDKLFLEGFENSSISRYANDLLIEVVGQDRAVSVADWFLGSEYKLSEIIIGGSISVNGLFPDMRTGGVIEPQWSYLGDGFVLESSVVETFVINQTGTSRGDNLIGGNQNNSINGGDGNDRIFGLAGDDEIAGGRGRDTLNGGDGNDTYFFNVGGDVDYIADPGGIDTLVFGGGITAAMLKLGLGSLLIHISDNGDAVHIEGFDPTDVHGSGVIENFLFVDDAELSYSQLVSRGIDIHGADGNDALTGTNIHDRFEGGAGNDVLTGGAGSDAYYFNAGDGIDMINDFSESGEINRIVLRDYLETGVVGSREGDYVVLRAGGSGDELRIRWDDATGLGVDEVEFADGAVWNRAYLGSLEISGNQPPVVAVPIGPVAFDEDAASGFMVPAHTFQEADAGDMLDFSAALADDGALPSWLSFDPETRTFSGTPANGDVGTIQIRVTATDGAGASVSDTFSLSVLNTNDAPELAAALADQNAVQGQSFSFVLPAESFADQDMGDLLTYTATLASGAPLPEWLVFDDATHAFSGVPGNADVGMLNVRVTATDGEGAAVSDTFAINVDNVNDAPVLGNPLADQAVTAGSLFSYVVPVDTFVDADTGDSLSLTARLADGSDLPGWLSFDAATGTFSGTFSGTPSASNVGVLEVEVVATDLAGAVGSDPFTLTVNAAPGQILTGTAGADVLAGGFGNDLIDGLAGADRMTGGDGDDTYVVDHVADTIVELPDEGRDSVLSSVTYTLPDEVEDLTLSGTANRNATGNELSNVITGNAGANRLDGGAGTDVLVGGLGNDTYVVDDVLDAVFETASAGTDTVLSSVSYVLSAHVEHLTLTGEAAIDGTGNELANTITGNEAANTLLGGLGNDRLIGGGDIDTLVGGLGNDAYITDSIEDILIEFAGEGTDTVQAPFEYTLPEHFENLVLTGEALAGTGNGAANRLTGNTLDNVLSGLDGNDVLNGGGGADIMIGGAGNDTYIVDDAADVTVELAGEGTDTVQTAVTYAIGEYIERLVLTGNAAINGSGNALDNRLTGNAAANTLYGFEGNDILDGKAGADVLIGGLGNDSYIVDQADDIIVEFAGEGIDTVTSGISYALSEHVENLTLSGSGAVDGTGNVLDNRLTGNAAANVLYGMDGNDILDGKGGADNLIGGAGNDVYVIDSLGDVAVEYAGEGIDTVQTMLEWTLADHLENLTLTGSAVVDGAGNAADNTLAGNAGANVLRGLDGNDLLDGGAGADILIGGAGDDRYVVDRSTDVVVETAGEGIDTVYSRVSWTLGDHLEHLVLTGTANIAGTGNALDNSIAGNAGNNTLDGGAGADFMAGGLGNDIYVVDDAGDVVSESAGGGIDTVRTALGHVLSDHVENLTLTGAAAVDATGNMLDNVLTGNSAANVLTGLEGNDTLDGKGGADVMHGGQGDDVYVVDNAGDLIIELAGEGTDTVRSSLSHVLGAHLENLVLTGSANRSATGNALDNVISGNNGANILAGLEGDDILAGGRGNDTYRFDAGFGRDVILEDDATAGNMDRILFGGGISAADLDLGRFDDDLFIHSGDRQHSIQVLDWFAADANKVERIEFADGTSWDVAAIGFLAMQNVDMPGFLRGSGDVSTLLGQIGNTVLESADGDDVLVDEDGNNVFSAGAGDDAATGGAGNDLFIGGTGNDTLVTGAGSNLIAYNAGDGVDTVYSQAGAGNVLSLGGGLDYSDLSLSRNDNDLVLGAGEDGGIVLKDWYAGRNNVLNLQVILDASDAFDENSSDPLRNRRVQNFDFLGLVGAFDAAYSANPGLSSWALGDALTQYHLSGSGDAAIGGDLAYWYARNNSLTGISLAAAQGVIGAAGFGAEAQSLRPFSGLQEGLVHLG